MPFDTSTMQLQIKILLFFSHIEVIKIFLVEKRIQVLHQELVIPEYELPKKTPEETLNNCVKITDRKGKWPLFFEAPFLA